MIVLDTGGFMTKRSSSYYKYAVWLFLLCLISLLILDEYSMSSQSVALAWQLVTPVPTPEVATGMLCVTVFQDINRNAARELGEDNIPNLQIRVFSTRDNSMVAQRETKSDGTDRCFFDLPVGEYIVLVNGGHDWNPTGHKQETVLVTARKFTDVMLGFVPIDATRPIPLETWIQQNTWLPIALISSLTLIGLVTWVQLRAKHSRPTFSRGARAVIIGLMAAACYGLVASFLTPLGRDSLLPSILSVPSLFLTLVVRSGHALAIQGLGALFWFGVGATVAYRVSSIDRVISICLGVAVVLMLLSIIALLGLFSQFPPI